MWKWIVGAVALAIGAPALMVMIMLATTQTPPLPEGSASAVRDADAGWSVATRDVIWEDSSRGTQANGEYPGAETRTFPVTIWYPDEATTPQPLIVYSHGFMGVRAGGTFLGEYLAARGYIVAAPDFPLTNLDAPGGAYMQDVVNQSADVSFVIDQMLAGAGDIPVELDPERIGVVGLSLGGLTSTLVTFHREWRDPRIKASVSMAGPADVFGPDFFQNALASDSAQTPFLMIGGTLDGIVNFEANAAIIPARISSGGLLTLERATHLGFDQFGAGWIRIFPNVDAVPCTLIGLAPPPEAIPSHPFSGLFGGAELGLVEIDEYGAACHNTDQKAMPTLRQHQLTQLAVHAFFGSHLALDSTQRAAHHRYLTEVLPAEAPEARWAPAEL